MTAIEAMEEMDVSKSTFYRRKNEYEKRWISDHNLFDSINKLPKRSGI
jgi:DNA invertase Pin-like site-specific DNA recombinase